MLSLIFSLDTERGARGKNMLSVLSRLWTVRASFPCLACFHACLPPLRMMHMPVGCYLS